MDPFMKWLLGTKSDHDQEREHLKAAVKNMSIADRESFSGWLQDSLDAVPAGNGPQQVMLRLARHQFYQLILDMVDSGEIEKPPDD